MDIPLRSKIRIVLPFAHSKASSSVGIEYFPQTANLLTLVKLVGNDGDTKWVSYWYSAYRENFNEIQEYYTNELTSIDVYAESELWLGPIKTFIENSIMLPINWLSRIEFTGANKYYGLGASEDSLEDTEPEFNSIVSSDNELEDINRDFYFIFPETSSGIMVPFTVNLNPSFTCGDGKAEESLGETWETCCLDDPCPEIGGSQYYCDWSGGSSDYGRCKDPDLIRASASISSVSPVSDCSEHVNVDIQVDITSNVLSALPKQ